MAKSIADAEKIVIVFFPIRVVNYDAIRPVGALNTSSLLPHRGAPPKLLFPHELLLRQAEPALPPLVVDERRQEVFFGKIGPERIGKIKLGVRSLPQEKVADPFFSARADDQVRIGKTRGIKVR